MKGQRCNKWMNALRMNELVKTSFSNSKCQVIELKIKEWI